jgi:hypothetical protein
MKTFSATLPAACFQVPVTHECVHAKVLECSRRGAKSSALWARTCVLSVALTAIYVLFECR